MTDIHLTVGDFRKVYCLAGVRRIFAEVGLDYNHFLDHGAMASELRGHGYDAMIDRVVLSKTGTD